MMKLLSIIVLALSTTVKVQANPSSTLDHCRIKSCSGMVEVIERGNRDYAWYYLKNHSSSDVNVIIRNEWTYNHQHKSETKNRDLYPGQEENIFNFDRKQRPRCCILHCRVRN